ncbi:MAG: CDP-glucose 4,6-dehydratase [Burkholderiaceae bacterium]|uniref:CDP-glucose 4,6-dehydratase n=1 Tax=Polaromonas sp. YR568 TaxID=1855301 RepID=UPI002715B63D|nr:CDP-glucose 4,6-dehydratase [Burkholderiaceae bacterium]MDO9316908.1 CDP-glucose 4,6-dehydratase [Gammaproteobacteria bacterium]
MGSLVRDSYLEVFRGKRVLVTGHTGFKGSWLTLLLRSLGAEVMGYALPPEYEDSHFVRLGLEKSIRHVNSDIRDGDRLLAEVAAFQPEIVFHLAAQALVRSSYVDPKTTFDVNVGGGVNLLEAVRRCETVRALVFITSDKCYENLEWIWGYRESDAMGGHDPYSASKGAVELVFSSYLRSFLAQRPNFGAATARAGNVIGGGDWASNRIVPDCIRAIQSGQSITIRSPSATRPWQHVLEPISGYLKLAASLYEQGHAFDGAWNFGPQVGDVRTVLDVANAIAAQFEEGRVIIDEPLNMPHEAGLLQLNSDKARQLLKWDTRWDFDQTMAVTGGWYKAVLVDGRPADTVSREQISQYYGGQL